MGRTAAHWAAYNDSQHGRAPRSLCTELIDLAGHGAGRGALDLGCGAGVETRALLLADWRVYAVDAAPGTRQRVLAATADLGPDRLTVETTDVRQLTALPPAELIYAGYSLPYLPPGDFARVWALIRASLLPGGWLGVDLFGERDSWAGDQNETFLSRVAARELFHGLEVIRFGEQDEDGPAYSGPKHWHVFEVVARRPRQ